MEYNLSNKHTVRTTFNPCPHHLHVIFQLLSWRCKDFFLAPRRWLLLFGSTGYNRHKCLSSKPVPQEVLRTYCYRQISHPVMRSSTESSSKMINLLVRSRRSQLHNHQKYTFLNQSAPSGCTSFHVCMKESNWDQKFLCYIHCF